MSTYIAIDLKSFYASVECVERGLDPMTTNLVVADASRTDKTICLAVSPSLKSYGIGGRARLFEVAQQLRKVNRQRQSLSPSGLLNGKSVFAADLQTHPDWEVDYITATPRMAFYIDYSTRIYNVYLNHVSADDIHVYSIDEVFIDATQYIELYHISAHELARRMISDVLRQTGITATAGIGSNLYLCKIAMDIVAKHIPADADGVRIATLDEMSYRRQLWSHRPLTDFWRIGHGIAARLEANGMTTMGDVARCSINNEELLYKLFGVNAELIIDHAWGWEPCTIDLIKQYRPESNSLSSSQVLSKPYSIDKARIVVREMADSIALNLVAQRLVTDQMVLYIGYDTASLNQENATCRGNIVQDYYGRPTPKPAHSSTKLGGYTNSAHRIVEAIMQLYDSITQPPMLVRRISIATMHIISETEHERQLATATPKQLNLFCDPLKESQRQAAEEAKLKKERRMQEALVGIKKKYGKNAILKGTNFEEGATAKERNQQIGGHKA